MKENEPEYDPERACPYQPCYITTNPQRCFGNYSACIIYKRLRTIKRGRREDLAIEGEIEKILKLD